MPIIIKVILVNSRKDKTRQDKIYIDFLYIMTMTMIIIIQWTVIAKNNTITRIWFFTYQLLKKYIRVMRSNIYSYGCVCPCMWGRWSWERRRENKGKRKRNKEKRNKYLFIQINTQTDRQTERRTDRHKSFIDMRYNTKQYSKSDSIESNRIESYRINLK